MKKPARRRALNNPRGAGTKKPAFSGLSGNSGRARLKQLATATHNRLRVNPGLSPLSCAHNADPPCRPGSCRAKAAPDKAIIPFSTQLKRPVKASCAGFRRKFPIEVEPQSLQASARLLLRVIRWRKRRMVRYLKRLTLAAGASGILLSRRRNRPMRFSHFFRIQQNRAGLAFQKQKPSCWMACVFSLSPHPPMDVHPRCVCAQMTTLIVFVGASLSITVSASAPKPEEARL